MFYSKDRNGFFDPAIHKVMPADAVEVSNDDYQYLLGRQAQGYIIEADAKGRPVSVAPKVDEQAVKNSQARKYLADTDWYVTRFVESGVPIPAEVSQKRAEARASVVG